MESGQELLQQILLGGRLSDKLSGEGALFKNLSWAQLAPIGVIESPCREGLLAPHVKAKSAFPKPSEIRESPLARGRLLHFFANHELLAIETMAYVLLRFPDAPEGFRRGVFHVLQEEQSHFRAYLSRMEDYGVQFGEVPLNLYFWNTLKEMRSPLDFVAQMSLTFEQANLDFALEFANRFESECDDPKTATLLRKVHDDEIRHVEHGWKWFQEWTRSKGGSDFEAYRSILPFPMNPRRARGGIFFAAESRARAGLSPDFIEKIRISGGSRGRVPDYYFFNPQCEIESEKSTLSKSLQDRIEDLEPLMLWLASESDVVRLIRRPSLPFLGELHCKMGEAPEIITEEVEESRFPALNAFKPWGFSKSAWDRFDRLSGKFRSPPAFDRGLHREQLFSKAYWKAVLGMDDSVITREKPLEGQLDRARAQNTGFSEWIIKSAIGTSGRGHLRLSSDRLTDRAIHEKLKRRLSSESALIFEPFYEKDVDFSVQYEILPGGRVLEFEPRLFEIDESFQYKGAWLGRVGVGAVRENALSFISQSRSTWFPVHQKIIEHLKSLNYVGPFGVDALIARGFNEAPSQSEPFVVPFIEVNVRYTMGRVAHAIEKALRRTPGFKNGLWVFVGSQDLACASVRSFSDYERVLRATLQDRLVATTPSETARGLWTLAVVNPEAQDRKILESLGFIY